MLNFYTIETEAGMRQRDLQRAAAADARAAQARPANSDGSRRKWGVASLSLAKLPALALPHMPAGAPLELRRVPRPVEC